MPVIVTAVWVYFGLSEATGVNFSVFVAGVISLTLLYSAFISEIYRSALEAIPRGQREAGLALGMSRLRIFVSVILPQATKIAIPNIGSMLIGMIKDTSVLFVIGLTELVRDGPEPGQRQLRVLHALHRGGDPLHRRRVHRRLRLPHHREDDADTAARAPRPRGEGPAPAPGRELSWRASRPAGSKRVRQHSDVHPGIT